MSLQGPAAQLILDAVHAATARGVAIRLAFNQEHRKAPAVPPPGYVDWDLVKQFGVPLAPIPGEPDLMHHKYAIRDAQAVWTGSTNWTTDSWTREENVIVEVLSTEVAAAYANDFEELWTRRDVALTGHYPPAWIDVGGLQVRPYFAPGRGEKLSHEIAQRLATAQRRVRVCSPVITSGPILGTLAEVIHDGNVEVRGIYDRTQMVEVEHQWAGNPLAAWKIAAFQSVVAAGGFASKVSTPYAAGTTHDYMHAKLTVADDTLFVGSYNLSHSGEQNAENVLEIQSPELAEAAAAFVDRLIMRYR